jgi:hypothetical protein
MSFKQFMEQQPEQIDSSEANKHYEDYKEQHQQKQAEIFYASHKDESWIKEKYDL